MILAGAGRNAVAAQSSQDAPAPEATTRFPPADDSRWWVSYQVNLISQMHGRFASPYAGDNSLPASREQALARVRAIRPHDDGDAYPSRAQPLFSQSAARLRDLDNRLAGPQCAR